MRTMPASFRSLPPQRSRQRGSAGTCTCPRRAMSRLGRRFSRSFMSRTRILRRRSRKMSSGPKGLLRATWATRINPHWTTCKVQSSRPRCRLRCPGWRRMSTSSCSKSRENSCESPSSLPTSMFCRVFSYPCRPQSQMSPNNHWISE